jgi:hypothetical protein
MLHQNWFKNPRFEQFDGYGDSQSFYDTETGYIYIIFEEYGRQGSTIIHEITDKSIDYKPNYETYKKSKYRTYNVKFIMSEEYTIEACNPKEAEQIARDKFGNNYLIDDVIISERKGS